MKIDGMNITHKFIQFQTIINENICYLCSFGRCEGNIGCGKLCKCQTNADCDTGYECAQAPNGVLGCDPSVTNSCIGLCMAVGSSCGGLHECQRNETCIIHSNIESQQQTGSCYSLPQQC